MRVVRNFWVTVDVDGRRGEIATGPRASSGGFQVRVQQRHNGEAIDAIAIDGSVDSSGALLLEVRDSRGAIVHQFRTQR